MVTANNDTDLY